MKKCGCETVCMWLLVVSGILWGLVGLFDFNLVVYLVGPTWAMQVIYVIFGIAAIWVLIDWRKTLKNR